MVGSRSPWTFAGIATLVLLVAATGCISDLGEQRGIVVTSQPLMDAIQQLDGEDQLVGIPDWAIVEEPLPADRVGRPFVIETEELARLEPALVLDQPHPLVSGPSRTALATGLDQAGIEHRRVATGPGFSTIQETYEAAGDATGTSHEPAWQALREDMDTLNATLEEADRPRAMFLFPAGLVAGENTDAGLILELAGMRNAAAEMGLSGYAAMSTEAIQRSEVELVIATATMRATAEEIASRPMFQDTAIEQRPDRVLVVDPSHTTRLGPHVDQAARMLAAWSHPDAFPGPSLSATLAPSKVRACETVNLSVDAPNASVQLLGETYAPGAIEVPDVEEGHYRLTVRASDESGTSSIDTMLSVEGSTCA